MFVCLGGEGDKSPMMVGGEWCEVILSYLDVLKTEKLADQPSYLADQPNWSGDQLKWSADQPSGSAEPPIWSADQPN